MAEAIAALPGLPPPGRTAEVDRSALPDAARAWCLAASFACQLPLLLQLPGWLGPAIGALAIGVAMIAWKRRLPSLLRALLALAAVGVVLAGSGFSFGRDTGCALLAAMLAIKPVELFTWRDARSLLGFALFAPFATFLLDQGPLSLLLGLAGALVALAALWRLAELDAAVPVEPLPPVQAAGRRLWRVARLALVGLPLALAAFWLFPRMASPMWGVPERAIARPGLSGEMGPGDWLDLMGDDSPALRARFFGPVPERTQLYWRGPVLTDYDGRRWSRAEWAQGLPPAEVRTGGPVWDYELELEPTDRRFGVTLDLPLAEPDGTRLGHDHSTTSWRPLSSLRRWRLQSAAPAAYEAELRPMLRTMALRLPAGFNPRTIALARQWRAEAGTGVAADEALVQRFNDWVRSEFAYTLATGLPGRHAVDEFLFDEQEGFCEHYAGAFVVFMRAAGIPARVVTGYVGGYYNRFGDYWLVRREDAHAWAEVWLEGRGWVRADPTAAVAPERIYDTIANLSDGGGAGLRGLSDMWDMGDWLRRGWNDFVLGFDATRQRQLLQPLGIRDLDAHQLIALFAALGGMALAWMLWLVARGERERDPVLRAWHRLGARYARHALAPEPHEPARAWTARVLAARPHDTSLATLSARFSDWRYAPHPAGSTAVRALVRDLRRHRPAEMPR
ncbi:hypothetical protein CO641_02780 [Lysobacteraceae bacterium NML91-0213]|nr:hypothetical protein CO641_02780 [Xanthomonadaceae bacterium NML91-0213]